MTQVVLLGPQRPEPTVGDAVRALTSDGETVGVISAGWQEAENDLDDLSEIINRPLADLLVYARCESLLERSPELARAHHERQATLQSLQRLYRRRLQHLINAAVDIFEVDDTLVPLDQRHAITQVRALDRHHLQRVRAAHAAFIEETSAFDSAPRDALRAQIEQILADVSTVVITGGNVGALMSRMRLLGLGDLLADKHIVAWSAGAMALCERVVLYHDLAPQGRRDAELFDEGFGVVPGVVALPNARRRLDETQPTRVGLMARRLAPRRAIALDNPTQLTLAGGVLRGAVNARQLTRSGTLKAVRAR
ncbi:MAG: hypothetical protein AAF610_06305 [Pseudomonadota bacterium]